MPLRPLALALATASFPLAVSSLPADASDRDARFFGQIEGSWRGPGEIVAGKYKGTKFTCQFDGSTPADKHGMTLDGGCRVGVFSQKMSATVARKGNTYLGEFLDGADGEGLDVVAGNVNQNGVVFTLKRNDLNGAMLARLASENQLNITVSVHVDNQLVPVVGMKLDRVDSVKLGSVD